MRIIHIFLSLFHPILFSVQNNFLYSLLSIRVFLLFFIVLFFSFSFVFFLLPILMESFILNGLRRLLHIVCKITLLSSLFSIIFFCFAFLLCMFYIFFHSFYFTFESSSTIWIIIIHSKIYKYTFVVTVRLFVSLKIAIHIQFIDENLLETANTLFILWFFF